MSSPGDRSHGRFTGQYHGRSDNQLIQDKKIVSNPETSACAGGFIDSVHTQLEVKLNANSIPSSTSLILNITSKSFSHVSEKALVDSSSTHCFLDHSLIQKFKIPTRSISPIPLKLFNGRTSSMITEAVELPIHFSSNNLFSVDFYVTALDPSCSIVLRHNWLTHQNPLIEWVSGSITFRTSEQTDPMTSPTAKAHATTKSSPAETPPKLQAPPIALINVAAFKRACRMEGSVMFQLNIAPSNVKGGAANLKSELVDMESVPEAYWDFSDVFSKAKADTLAPHRPYDLKIALEDGAIPPQPPIYSLSNSKLGTLWEFIDEHLNIGFIWPSRSSHGTPILFVKKKDGSLWLCVDFQSLNKVTKKDHYPLPLIMDLLDAPWKARIYTKIDLQHVYHLIWIDSILDPLWLF